MTEYHQPREMTSRKLLKAPRCAGTSEEAEIMPSGTNEGDGRAKEEMKEGSREYCDYPLLGPSLSPRYYFPLIDAKR